MAVIQSKQLPDGYTPHCSECGIALCYDISEAEYQELTAFWDGWCCASCNPDASGSYLRARDEARKGMLSDVVAPNGAGITSERILGFRDVVAIAPGISLKKTSF